MPAKFIIFFLFVFYSCTAYGQQLYSKAFGDANNKAVIFIHGGPGSSAVYFEATTAQKLADQGFYVVIYDRRGEGRSVDPAARMNYAEAFNDLNDIFQKYELKNAALIGFSFGGLVATLFTERYTEKVNSLVLVSALISQQDSYNTILRSTRKIYQQKGDRIKLAQLEAIEKSDKNSVAYRDSIFKHAIANKFFTVGHSDEPAKAIYASYNTDTLISGYVKNEEAVHTFWENEPLKNIDISPVLTTLRHKGLPVYALYGKQDGLYSERQIRDLQLIIGPDNLEYLDNCSHTLFVDQQAKFVTALHKWLTK